MSKKLFGVGVGAGDPGLMTLRAVEILKKVDYICAPVSVNSESSKSLKIIEEVVEIKDKIIKLDFKMSKDKKELEKSRSEAAEKIYQLLEKDKKVAFITLGDPLFYSTFIYIKNKIKEMDNGIEIETAAGINSIASCTASRNLALAEGRENTAIISDLKSEEYLQKVLNLFETVIILKLSRNFKKAYNVLDSLNLKNNVLIGSKCGFEEEFYTEDIELLKNQEVNYLSLMIIKRKGI